MKDYVVVLSSNMRRQYHNVMMNNTNSHTNRSVFPSDKGSRKDRPISSNSRKENNE